jgi:hypothetical protein
VCDCRTTREPPLGTLLEEVQRAMPDVLVLRRVTDFIEASKQDDRGPVEPIVDILDFEADLRIVAHPVDFLADRRETEETVGVHVVCEGHRHDVRLFAASTSEMSKAGAGQHVAALRGRQFMNQHCADRSDVSIAAEDRGEPARAAVQRPSAACILRWPSIPITRVTSPDDSRLDARCAGPLLGVRPEKTESRATDQNDPR